MGMAYVLNILDIQTIWKTMLLFCALQITANPPFVVRHTADHAFPRTP